MTRFNMRLTEADKIHIQTLKTHFGFKKTSELIRYILTVERNRK